MPRICRQCGRRKDNSRDEKTGRRRRNREHVCSIVVIERNEKDDATQRYPTKIVHEDRVDKGGDLHELVTGRGAPWSVSFRNRQRIESAIEKRKSKKNDEKKLVAPSGEPLIPPKG